MQYHYTYSITYTDEPNIYYGVRTSKCIPEKDTRYWGSPKTFKTWMDAHKATRVKTILSTYPTREEAQIAEKEIILEQWKIDKSLSLNAVIGNSEKFNTLGMRHSEEMRKMYSEMRKGEKHPYYGKKHAISSRIKMSDAKKGEKHRNYGKKLPSYHSEVLVKSRVKTYIGTSPTGETVIFTNATKFCRDNPEWDFRQAKISKCALGYCKHHRGWKFAYYHEDMEDQVA